MLSRAALLYDQGQEWVVEQIDVNEGYRAMRDGENIRGVITYG